MRLLIHSELTQPPRSQKDIGSLFCLSRLCFFWSSRFVKIEATFSPLLKSVPHDSSSLLPPLSHFRASVRKKKMKICERVSGSDTGYSRIDSR